MIRKKIWYSVHNGGDGSAYIVLMESEELARLDQHYQDEGWGEPCYGSITLESESEITVVDEVHTVDSMIEEIEDELAQDYLIKYKKQGKYPTWWGLLENHLEALKKLK
jgi:hypothetical protein